MVTNKERHIEFHFINASFYFPYRTRLKDFLIQLFKKENFSVDKLNYIFCTDNYLFRLNQDYLKHNTYTDILTFDLSGKNEPILADIYISFERVRENARLYHTNFTRELHRVIFHGALHLCGYQDKKAKEKKEMRRMEEFYLDQYFVPRETKPS